MNILQICFPEPSTELLKEAHREDLPLEDKIFEHSEINLWERFTPCVSELPFSGRAQAGTG